MIVTVSSYPVVEVCARITFSAEPETNQFIWSSLNV